MSEGWKGTAFRLLILLGLVISRTGWAEVTTATETRPNIIIILADDVGWSDLSCFGSEIETPNLDKLANGGVRFTQFYNTARCCPSRASLLTGLYPHQAGVGHMLHPTFFPGYSDRLSSNCVTIAEALRHTGYRTYMVGKWHLAPFGVKESSAWPMQRGFEKYYGTLSGAGSYFNPAALMRGNSFITPLNDPEYRPAYYYYTDALSDNALKFVQAHRGESPEKPFFMYLAYTAAHWPLQAPEDEVARFKGRYDAGFDAVRQARIERQKKLGLMVNVTTPSATVGDWSSEPNKAFEARCMEVYAAQISRMDQGIGRLVESLRAQGMLENTVIFFMQDNGGCAEDFGHSVAKPFPKTALKPMGPDELQKVTWPPLQTRDGRPIRSGPQVMPGPEDTFISYSENWANVSNTPFRYYKHFLHEGGISTPLVVYWPKGISPERRNTEVTQPGHLIDIMPTCLELAHAPYPQSFHGNKITSSPGVNLLPTLAGGTVNRSTPLFWEHESNRAVRDGNWKLVSRAGQPWELYDMDIDRGETHNIARDNKQQVTRLAEAWSQWASKSDVLPLGAWRAEKRPKPKARVLHLMSGEALDGEAAPSITDAGVSITATVLAPLHNGVIVAHGDLHDGYALYYKSSQLHFAVRRDGVVSEIHVSPSLPAEKAVVIHAELDLHGHSSLALVQGADGFSEDNIAGHFISTPSEALAVGRDDIHPVGDYAAPFPYGAGIEWVDVEVISEPVPAAALSGQRDD